MIFGDTTIASKIRVLHSRRLGQNAYLSELIELADLDQAASSIDRIETLARLRSQIVELEQRVRELEAQK